IVCHRERGVGCDLRERPAERFGQAGKEQGIHVAIIEVAPDLGRDDHVLPDALERLAQDLFGMAVAVHVGRVEEVASQVIRATHGAPRFGVVGCAVGVAEPVAAGRSGIVRITTSRGRYACRATRCMSQAAPLPLGPDTAILVTGFTAQSTACSSVAPYRASCPATPPNVRS